MCYEGISIVLRKKTYPSQVNLLEFPEGVTGQREKGDPAHMAYSAF